MVLPSACGELCNLCNSGTTCDECVEGYTWTGTSCTRKSSINNNYNNILLLLLSLIILLLLYL